MAERGSGEHGFRIDDQMKEEVEPIVRSGREARSDEGRSMEGPADGEPVPDVRIASPPEPLPHALTREEAEERGFLADNLDLKGFPADRDALVASAEERFAPDEVVARLRSLPPERTFATVAEVWEALGGRTEHRLEEPGPE